MESEGPPLGVKVCDGFGLRDELAADEPVLVQVGMPILVTEFDDDSESVYSEACRWAVRQKGASLVVAVVPNDNKQRYDAIKKVTAALVFPITGRSSSDHPHHRVAGVLSGGGGAVPGGAAQHPPAGQHPPLRLPEDPQPDHLQAGRRPLASQDPHQARHARRVSRLLSSQALSFPH